jgi:hypothetical protein
MSSATSSPLPEYYTVQLGTKLNPSTPESLEWSETCLPDIWARLSILEAKVGSLESALISVLAKGTTTS